MDQVIKQVIEKLEQDQSVKTSLDELNSTLEWIGLAICIKTGRYQVKGHKAAVVARIGALLIHARECTDQEINVRV